MIITNNGIHKASITTYDNSNSGITATTVQNAIDSIVENYATKEYTTEQINLYIANVLSKTY